MTTVVGVKRTLTVRITDAPKLSHDGLVFRPYKLTVEVWADRAHVEAAGLARSGIPREVRFRLSGTSPYPPAPDWVLELLNGVLDAR